MTPQDITAILQTRFAHACEVQPPNSWQVETSDLRLLVLLSEDHAWLRLLVPIVSMAEAQPYLAEILAANFARTTCYATHENLLWGVFQHNLVSLGGAEFSAALDQLIGMKQAGVSPFFNALIETKVRQLIQSAKLQGQSLETTLQTINRFYEEGVMGNMEDSNYGRQALASWQRQLERLWPEVNPDVNPPEVAGNG